ncbi:MAG: hypothetical protein LBD76_01595 [Prevotellaceae bacterium]|nr:hypothetical protein [Prevotellaceae bacterium]
MGLITGGKSGQKIILPIKGFIGNPFGGHTIEPPPHRLKTNATPLPKELAYNRGGKGKSEVEGVKILTPARRKRRTRITSRAKSANSKDNFLPFTFRLFFSPYFYRLAI